LAVIYSQYALWRYYFGVGPVTHFNRAGAFFKEGNYKSAQSEYLAAVTSSPVNAPYHAGLALAYQALGKDQKALGEFKNTIRLDSENPISYYNMAKYYTAVNSDLAYEEYGMALMHADASLRLKILESMYEDYGQNYFRLMRIVPMEGIARYSLAEFFRGKKIYDKSKYEYKKAVILAGKRNNREIEADSLNWIGIIRMWENNFSDALVYLKAAAKIKKRDPGIFQNLGISYFRLGELDNAKAAFENAARLNPPKAAGPAYYFLGMINEEKGLLTASRQSYWKALQLELDEPTRADIKNRLK
jgi:tetratricopeptide (TPR) repeat protein